MTEGRLQAAALHSPFLQSAQRRHVLDRRLPPPPSLLSPPLVQKKITRLLEAGGTITKIVKGRTEECKGKKGRHAKNGAPQRDMSTLHKKARERSSHFAFISHAGTARAHERHRARSSRTPLLALRYCGTVELLHKLIAASHRRLDVA